MTGNELIDRIASSETVLSEEYGCDKALGVKQNSGYVSLLFFNQVFLRVRETKLGTQIELKKSFISDIGCSSATFSFAPSSPDWGKSILTDEIAATLFNNLSVVFFRCYAMISDNVFGCCNNFIECSDARRCTHANKLFASACLYRSNLESGKVFYGKNRNID